MSPTPNHSDTETEALIDRLASTPALQSNCMFQLALMVARIATEPCAETYKDETAQALMGLIRAKPKSNVVKLFATSFSSDFPSQSKQTISVVPITEATFGKPRLSECNS